MFLKWGGVWSLNLVSRWRVRTDLDFGLKGRIFHDLSGTLPYRNVTYTRKYSALQKVQVDLDLLECPLSTFFSVSYF